jgi:very-short-patch-repair endonuclease
MPRAEVILWTHLKGKQLNGLKFRRQHSIGQYVVDFYCAVGKLAIEIDGESHLSNQEVIHDQTRDAYIKSCGVSMLRVLNTDIYENISGVIETIIHQLEIVKPTTPFPSSGRRG